MLRPRYQSTDSKINVAWATEKKQNYKDRVYRDMFSYHMYQNNPIKAKNDSGTTEEENMQLLIKKYEEAISHPFKLKANREFLML